VTIRNSNFTSISANRGGFSFSSGLATQATTSSIQYIGPIFFSAISAKTAGGGFYYDHPMMSVNMKTFISLSDCHVSNGNGGVFYLS
jgi:hypothetical protein